MGFSNQERININSKALAASVFDANSVAQWYESRFPFAFIVKESSVLSELSSVPIAADLATARTNASNNPSIIQDLSQNASAVRLTVVGGTNNSTYVAYQTYNDTSSTQLINWLQPQLIPQSSGVASIGYAIQLYDGNPNSGGTLITTSDGTTGTGDQTTVGWIFNYANGMLLLSSDFKNTISDPYVVGFRYIGRTGSQSTSSSKIIDSYVADETIAIGDLIRYVTSDDVGLTVGRVIKANNTSDNNSESFGVATSSGSQGDPINVASFGKSNVTFTSPPATTSIGKPVYLSATSGKCTTTPPTTSGRIVYRIGRLNNANGSDITVSVNLNFEFVIKLG
jgi:hypothetical protein